MGSLSNLYISQSYQSLIHLGTNNTASANLIELQDGLGNGLGVYVNTLGNISASGNIYATNLTGSTVDTSSLVTTSSFNSFTQSYYTDSASFNNRINNVTFDTSSLVSTSSFNAYTQSNDSKVNALIAKTGSYATTGSNQFNGDQNITGSLTASADIRVNLLTIGKGGGSIATNIAIGSASLQSNTTGNTSVAIGQNTLKAITTAANNIAIGSGVLQSLTSATAAQVTQNVVIGGSAGSAMIIGARNTIIGASAFISANNTERNTGIGRGVLQVIGTALGSGSAYNTAIGHNAGLGLSSGSNNVIIHGGNSAGEGWNSGSNNNIIGMDSGLPTSLDNSTIIGRGITGLTSPTSNAVILGDGQGNVLLRRRSLNAVTEISSSVIVSGSVETTGDITGSNIISTVNGSNAGFMFKQQSSGSTAFTYNTMLERDKFRIFQYQGQNYVFNMILTSDQLNAYTGSKFRMGLQTGGGPSITDYWNLNSGSTINGDGSIKGLDYLNTAQVNQFVAPVTIDQKLYVQQGAYVSASAGGTALTINAGTNTSISATGSVNVSGSITIQSGSGDLYVHGHKQFNYGAFQTNITKSGSASVSQSISFEITDTASGVSMVSGSRMTFANAGVYSTTFSAQVECSAGADTAWIWLKKNGTNVAESATKVVMANNTAQCLTVNFVNELNGGDYLELAWQNNAGNAKLLAENASGNIPAIPSVIITSVQVR